MAKKTQTQNMKDAYGARFSQQDLTVPEENVQPTPFKTPTYKEGGVQFLAAIARNRVLSFTKKDK